MSSLLSIPRGSQLPAFLQQPVIFKQTWDRLAYMSALASALQTTDLWVPNELIGMIGEFMDECVTATFERRIQCDAIQCDAGPMVDEELKTFKDLAITPPTAAPSNIIPAKTPPTVFKIQVTQSLRSMENLHFCCDGDTERTRRIEDTWSDTQIVHVWTIPADVPLSFADGVAFAGFIQPGKRSIMSDVNFNQSCYDQRPDVKRLTLIDPNLDKKMYRKPEIYRAMERIYNRVEPYHDFYIVKQAGRSGPFSGAPGWKQWPTECLSSDKFDEELCEFVKQDFFESLPQR